MNIFTRAIFTLSILTVISASARAQDNAGVADLIKQGTQLNDQGKFAEAIDKYNEALKLEPDNVQANYQMGFTLMASGKGNDGIPYAEKALKGNGSTKFTAACYDLLGTIYDQDHKAKKAIEAYQSGIKIMPDYQRLHYNLGIAYFRNKQYAEAESEAIEAIKLDPKHASSQRMYALVTFHQNKRVNALLGFCSFIILEPNTSRSAEAYNNIQSILKGGVLKDNSGRATIIISPKGGQDNEVLNMSVSMTTLTAQSKKLTGMDMLEYQLKHILGVAGELSEKKTDKAFFDQFFASYFYKLSQSSNMPAFTRLVSLSANKDENTKWMNDNDAQIKALDNWVTTTPRSF